MAAPKGNEFWKMRSSHGRAPIFKTPDDLWDAAQEYFQWVHDNPLAEDKVFSYQGETFHDTQYKMRAMTVEGLCLFLDITLPTWMEYRKREGFTNITSRIDYIIRQQKFTGAAADLLNPQIIARDLGLKDSSETELKGHIHLSHSASDLSDDDLAAILSTE